MAKFCLAGLGNFSWMSSFSFFASSLMDVMAGSVFEATAVSSRTCSCCMSLVTIFSKGFARFLSLTDYLRCSMFLMASSRWFLISKENAFDIGAILKVSLMLPDFFSWSIAVPFCMMLSTWCLRFLICCYLCSLVALTEMKGELTALEGC